MLTAPERFSADSRARLVAADTDLFLSAASSWEIAIKYSLGRLRLLAPPAEIIPALLAQTRTSPLPIEHSHALRVADLPLHHGDPFDRILIAQAQVERLSILTADPQFSTYDVEVIPV